MKLNKYGILAKKYLEEYKSFKFQELTMNGTIMDYLLDFQNHLNGYANLMEIELKPPSEKKSFMEQIKYMNMIQEMVDEFVKEKVKMV